jgi:hypothetical protein
MRIQNVRRLLASDRQLAIFIFLGLWSTYAFIGPGSTVLNSNTVTHAAVAFSIMKHGEPNINEFAHFTRDKAFYNGNYVADKAPGLALSAVPIVSLLSMFGHLAGLSTSPILDGKLTTFFRVSVVFSCVFTSGLFSAATAAVLYGLARFWHASRSASLYGALGFGLATPAFGWATVFFSHNVAGACLFIAFALIIFTTDERTPDRTRFISGCLAGGLLSWAVVVEFTSGPASLVLSLFALWRLFTCTSPQRWQILGSACVGGVFASLPLLAYNYLTFGSAFHIGYSDVVGFPGMKEGFFGISVPNAHVLWEITFDPYRGIVWIGPILLAWPLGCWCACKKFGSPTVVLAAIPALYLLINSAYHYWDGGASTGPRHITPAVPFVSLALVALWDSACPGFQRRWLLIGAIFSGLLSLVAASVTMTTAPTIAAPLPDLLVPAFLLGLIHNAVVSPVSAPMLGASHLWSLALLPLLWVCAAVVGSKLGSCRSSAIGSVAAAGSGLHQPVSASE